MFLRGVGDDDGGGVGDDDEDDVFQGEDEAMFVEYRKQLKMLLDRLAQVSPELLLEAVRRVFTSTMQ